MINIPKSECLDVWIRLPRHKWPKSWSNIEDTVVSLERNWYGHPLAGLLWEKHFEEVLLELGWEKLPNWACPFVHWELGFFSVYVDDTKNGWKEQSMAPVWKKFMKTLILTNQLGFLTIVYLGCTRRECKPIDIIIGEYTKVFESRISAGSTGQIPGWEKPHAKTVAWSYDMEGHAGKCAGRYCDLANKTVAQLYKVASLCLDDHQFKQEELESLGELSQVCSQTVIKCL